jgi:gluconate 2-dehydrogenase gamma chain
MAFFTEDELKCLAAFVDCLIPADSLGPSASEAGVVEFIDRQLSGNYGSGGQTYLGVSVHDDEPPPLTLSELYRDGIAALNQLSLDRTGKIFAALDLGERHALLMEIDAGKGGSSLKRFFDQVLENTTEGYFSDPVHGGNRDAASWKMIGYPGCGHDYREFIGKNIPVSDAVPLRTVAMIKKGF